MELVEEQIKVSAVDAAMGVPVAVEDWPENLQGGNTEFGQVSASEYRSPFAATIIHGGDFFGYAFSALFDDVQEVVYESWDQFKQPEWLTPAVYILTPVEDRLLVALLARGYPDICVLKGRPDYQWYNVHAISRTQLCDRVPNLAKAMVSDYLLAHCLGSKSAARRVGADSGADFIEGLTMFFPRPEDYQAELRNMQHSRVYEKCDLYKNIGALARQRREQLLAQGVTAVQVLESALPWWAASIKKLGQKTSITLSYLDAIGSPRSVIYVSDAQ